MILLGAISSVLSSFGVETAGFFPLSSSCHVAVSVLSLPHDVVGWTAVWDCGISWSYSLILYLKRENTVVNYT